MEDFSISEIDNTLLVTSVEAIRIGEMLAFEENGSSLHDYVVVVSVGVRNVQGDLDVTISLALPPKAAQGLGEVMIKASKELERQIAEEDSK